MMILAVSMVKQGYSSLVKIIDIAGDDYK